jgi:hypothetical protein
MKTENPWHGLLFLHGHIADPTLARGLAQDDSAADTAAAKQAGSLLRGLALLGGRPMHAGFNFDLEEPLVEDVQAPVRGDAPRTTQVACQAC